MRQHIEQARVFVQEVNQEMRRISWPLPREIAGATAVVIMATALISVLLALYDLLISTLLKFILR